MSEILGFRLINGQDIIASLVSQNDQVYDLENAMAMQYARTPPNLDNPQGGVQLSMVPVSLIVENPEKGTNLTLNRSAVAFTFILAPAYERHYTTEVTGLILAGPGAIVR